MNVASDLKILGEQTAFNKMMTIGLMTDATAFYVLHRYVFYLLKHIRVFLDILNFLAL